MANASDDRGRARDVSRRDMGKVLLAAGGAAALIGRSASPAEAKGTTGGSSGGEPIVTPADFGGVGDGSFDNSKALDQAVAACMTAGDPSTVVRTGTKTLFLPAGQWRTTKPLNIRGVLGFRMRGMGMTSSLVFDGAQTSGLNLEGVAFSSFEDFAIDTVPNSGSVVNALALSWNSAATRRSTTQNRFARLQVLGKFVNGYNIGVTSGGVQVDNDSFIHCGAFGSWTQGEGQWWQSGFSVGDDVHGNNLNHSFFQIEAVSVRYPLLNLATNLQVFGGALDEGEIAYVHASNHPSMISGIRSEGCQRFFTTGSGVAHWGSHIRITDIDFSGDSLAQDGQWIIFGRDGSLTLQNVRLANPSTTAKMTFTPAGSESGIRQVIILDGVSTPYLIQDAVNADPRSKVLYRSYQQEDSNALVVSMADQGEL